MLFLQLLLFLCFDGATAAGFFVIWPWAQCFLKLLFLGADVSNFDDYPRIFRDDSAVSLAEAGRYEGAEDIEEYLKFVFPGFTAYLTSVENIAGGSNIDFVGYKDGICEFQSIFTDQYVFSDETTNAQLAPNGIQTTTGSTIFFDYHGNYISEVRFFYFPGFLNFLFNGPFNSDKTRNFICEVYNGDSCAEDLTPVEDCAARLEALPLIDAGGITGNSSGCRVLHANFASTNSFHCPHISFPELPDDDGKFVCQTSLRLRAADLFTSKQLQAFRDASAHQGIDPDIGYLLP